MPQRNSAMLYIPDDFSETWRRAEEYQQKPDNRYHSMSEFVRECISEKLRRLDAKKE